MIIGISGKKGHGKDTVAKIIQVLIYNDQRVKAGFQEIEFDFRNVIDNRRLEYTGWQNRKFAKKLKQGLEIDFPEEFSEASWENLGDEYRDEIMPSLGISRREALQKKGVLHRQITPVYWASALMSEYIPTRKMVTPNVLTTIEEVYPNWIISDVRFPNDEASAIEDMGGYIVRVYNPRVGWTGDHESETAMDSYDRFDKIFDNSDSIPYLAEQVAEFLKSINLLK